MRARSALGLLVVAGALVAPATAGAHAVLRHVTPHADQTVQQAPTQVILDFNEPVGAGPGSVRVFDERGRRVDSGTILRPRSRSAGVTLASGLPRGVYTTTYRVVSADGHPVSGGAAFGVRAAVRVGRGGPTVEQLLADQGPGAVVEGAYGVARGLHYAALLSLIGAIAFWAGPWRAARRAERWPTPLLRVVAVVGVVSAESGLVLQGLLSTGLHLGSAFDGAVWNASFDTHTGRAWALRGALWLFVAMVVWPRKPWTREHVAWLVGLTLLLVATLPYGGHAGSQSPEGVLIPADVVHVLAAGVWLGGLVMLIAAFWPRDDERVGSGWLATEAFSGSAVWAIGALVVAGSLQAWFYLGRLGAFFDTTYGIALLAKIALVVAIVALGAGNRRRLRARTEHAGRALRRAMESEVVIAVAIIAATAVLVRAAPPKSIAEGPQEKELNLGPLRLELVAEPAQVGRNAFHLYLFNRKTGAQIDRVQQLSVRLAQPDARIAPIDVDIPRKGPAHYELLGQPLPKAGTWKVRVTARVSAFDEYAANTTLRIRK